jgi:NitT/TauT family transport system ATP-binding protein
MNEAFAQYFAGSSVGAVLRSWVPDFVKPARSRVSSRPEAATEEGEDASASSLPPVAEVPSLQVKDLVITYENQKTGEQTEAVSGVSLDIAPGEFVTVVGLSGCGKSSFLSAVAGLIKPAGGSISVAGRQVTKPGGDRSVVFQKATLLPWRTVLDNITYGLDLRGVPKKEARRRAEALVDLVQLRGFEHFHPTALSGGMQQRVNLARALVTDPHLLLLDEPFAALDAITRETMQSEWLSICDQTRKSVRMVTHEIDEAVLLSDRVIVFSNRPARIVAEIRISLPRPRTESVRYDPAFDDLVRRIFGHINSSNKTKASWCYEL